jgi:hypothetical protein
MWIFTIFGCPWDSGVARSSSFRGKSADAILGEVSLAQAYPHWKKTPDACFSLESFCTQYHKRNITELIVLGLSLASSFTDEKSQGRENIFKCEIKFRDAVEEFPGQPATLVNRPLHYFTSLNLQFQETESIFEFLSSTLVITISFNSSRPIWKILKILVFLGGRLTR